LVFPVSAALSSVSRDVSRPVFSLFFALVDLDAVLGLEPPRGGPLSARKSHPKKSLTLPFSFRRGGSSRSTPVEVCFEAFPGGSSLSQAHGVAGLWSTGELGQRASSPFLWKSYSSQPARGLATVSVGSFSPFRCIAPSNTVIEAYIPCRSWQCYCNGRVPFFSPWSPEKAAPRRRRYPPAADGLLSSSS